MPHKFVVKTANKDAYEFTDESHLFGSDHWVSTSRDGKEALLCFAELRSATHQSLVHTRAVSSDEYLQVMEGKVGNFLRTKSCIGKIMILIDEKQFSAALKYLEQLQVAARANDRAGMSRLWDVLSRSVRKSAPIAEVVEKF